jgi:hypothetical protein
MIKADVLDLNNAFADLLHLVRCQESKGFKVLCRRISTHLYPLIKDDIVRMTESDVYAAKRLIQLFSYTSRLSLLDLDLTEQCLSDYVKTEQRLSEPRYLPSHLTSALNEIIKRWMEAFDPSRIRFQHGPGGIAGHGRTSLEVKYKDLTSDALLEYVFGNPSWASAGIRSHLDRISSTIFVPKSYKTFRTISMESATLQYMQQGVWREIDRVVSSSGYLRSHIGFHDQTRNQRLAREGSIARNFATIDLSAASDSVSYELVKKLFRKTKLLPYLIATRSTKTLLPDGRLMKLKKFAPMGSALCFPVETIIFASICQFVTREHGVTADYSVFGDDIIVPTQCVEDVMLILETLGFLTNRSKSFYHDSCWFRESCGGEYCDGFDVTPMRVSRKYSHKEQLVRMTSLISLANEALKRGNMVTRAFFLHKLMKSGFRPLFGPNAVHSLNDTNYHLKSRYNPNLQRVEFKASSLKTSYHWVSTPRTFMFEDKVCRVSSSLPPEKSDEEIRYRHWLESTAERISIGDGFISRTSRSTVSVQNRWLASQTEFADHEFLRYALSKE